MEGSLVSSSYSSADEESWSNMMNMDLLMLTIVLVGAVDLAPAHRVISNSPTVTIGCGKKTIILPVSMLIL